MCKGLTTNASIKSYIAMIFQCSTVINKPVSEVYRFTLNPDNLQKWLSDIQHIEYTKGCPGEKGSKARYICEENGTEIIMEDEIVEIIENKTIRKRLSYKGIKMSLTNRFIDNGNNTMTLISTTEIQLQSIFLQCYNWLNKRHIQHRYQKDYLQLKRVIELV